MALPRQQSRVDGMSPAPVVFGVATALSLVPALVLYGGGDLPPPLRTVLVSLTFGFVALFWAEFALAVARARDRRRFLAAHVFETVLVGGSVLSFLAVATHPFGLFHAHPLDRLLAAGELFLTLNLIARTLSLLKLAASRRFHYARVFGVSFLLIIAIGALLLWLLPGSRAEGKELGFVDALFTATSATCVTGLVTVDTGAHFSRFGQSIILVLFQVGGLGLMTFAAFFAIALGKGMGIRDRQVMQGVLNLEVAGRTVKVVVGILSITLVIEALGTAALYSRWTGDLAPQDRMFASIFHSVSAFCNAGFSLQADSLEGYVHDPVVNLVVMLQIVVGGLGFGVMLELLGLPVLRPWRWARRNRRLGVQTKIVLVATAVLVLGGAGLLYLLERANPATLGDPALSGGERVQAAFFQSITARTAGFNTVPVGEMTEASQFLLLLLMMIGASPGSTGGGIKTVTAVVLLMSVVALIRGRPRVELFRRSIPGETVRRATVIVVASVLVLATATLIVSAVEGDRFPFLSLFFEVGSAFGTVGLSTGVTSALTPASKVVLCVVMLVGRIGPLSLVIALSQARARRPAEYPEEHVMIG